MALQEAPIKFIRNILLTNIFRILTLFLMSSPHDATFNNVRIAKKNFLRSRKNSHCDIATARKQGTTHPTQQA